MSETARQSTARDFIVGPILDADGVAVTDAVIADLKISKNGAAPAAFNGSATLTHRHTGFYSLGATATDLNTVGSGTVTIDDTVNCMPPKEITVVEEAVYDALFAASAAGYASQTSVDDLPTNAELATALAAADDAVLAAIAALNNLSQANIRTAIGLASANLDTQLGDLPTNAELATALAAADDAVLAAIAALNNLSAAGVRTAVGLASANLDTQLADLPTNAELATALGTADDAVLAAIAALNNLSEANIRTAVGLATANLDTQLGDIPTNSELATAIITGLTAALTEGYRGTGATGSVRDLLYEIIAHLGESGIVGTTKTLKKLDGSTTAKTYTLNDATTPTAVTETT